MSGCMAGYAVSCDIWTNQWRHWSSTRWSIGTKPTYRSESHLHRGQGWLDRHWNGNVNLMKFSSLAALKVVFDWLSAASEKNFIKMTFSFPHMYLNHTWPMICIFTGWDKKFIAFDKITSQIFHLIKWKIQIYKINFLTYVDSVVIIVPVPVSAFNNSRPSVGKMPITIFFSN